MYKAENWPVVPPIKLGSVLGGVVGFCLVHGMVSCKVLPLGPSGFSEPLPPRPFPSGPQGAASTITPFSGRDRLSVRAERSLIHPWAVGPVQLLSEDQTDLLFAALQLSAGSRRSLLSSEHSISLSCGELCLGQPVCRVGSG